MAYSYLIWIIFLPLVGAILIASIPRLSERIIKYLAATFTFVPLVFAVIAFAAFDRAAGGFQFIEKVEWISFRQSMSILTVQKPFPILKQQKENHKKGNYIIPS